jgi:tetratricopeptide (TPR) repeat protein
LREFKGDRLEHLRRGMAKSLSCTQRLGSARLPRFVAAALGLLGVLLLLSPASRADEIRSDAWRDLEHPTKEQCDAALSIEKETPGWFEQCRDVEGFPKADASQRKNPTPQQQQLAWDAEKACSGKTFEDAKDHDAFEECLTRYKVDAALAADPKVRAFCADAPDVSVCVDGYYAVGPRYQLHLEYRRLKEWGEAIERELTAHPRNSVAITPLGAVPKGLSADPKSTITGTGYGSQDTGQDYGQTGNQDIRGYDSTQQAVVGADGRKVGIQTLIAALQKVSPDAARNPFVVSTDGGTLTFSPEVQRVLAQQSDALNKVGGVELNITFQNLALLGVPDMRVAGPTTLIENPVLVSLKRLVAAAKPYVDTPEHWRALPEDIRYPGALGRVHGYVLDPAKGDVFIVGTAAKNPETRLDIDLFSVLMDVVWGKGLVPSVSLDSPLPPADRGGPQSVRIINLPTDALVARILLDADYEMKRIGVNLVKVDDPSFKSDLDILKAKDKGGHTSNRFWFHPTPLNPNSIRVGAGGRVALHDAGVQVLTEQMEGGYGTGHPEPWALESATEFTRAFPRIETSVAVKPAGIFGRLHGIADMVTMFKILRDSKVDYSVLNEFRKLPYRHLTGSEAVPFTYPGVTVSYRNAAATNSQLKGGVQLRIRKLRRALDRFEDEVAVRLVQAAEQFEGDGFSQTVPLTFRLAIQSNSNNAALLAMDAGLKFLNIFARVDFAIQAFADASIKDPTDTDAWAYLALANALAGHHDEARNAIAHAQGIDASDSFVRRVAVQTAFIADPSLRMETIDPAVRRDLSNAYVEQAETGLRWYQQHKLDDVFKDADLAVKWGPDNALAYVARGRAHEYRKESGEALRDFNKAIELDPNGALGPSAARAFAARANFFYMQNQEDRAIEDYTQAIRLAPTAEYYRERSRLIRGDYSRTLADLTEAINLDPTDSLSLEWRAELLSDNRNYDAAIQDYGRAIAVRTKLDSNPFDLLASRGDAYEKKGDLDHALADYTEAIRLHPDWASGFQRRGRLYHLKHDYDRAIADYNQAIRLDPKDRDAYKDRVQVYRDKGDYGHLTATYDDAIRRDPKDPSKYRERGKLLFAEFGEVDRAAADYTEAIKIETNPARGYIERAEFWAAAGQLDRAVADYTEVAHLDPAKGYKERAGFWRSGGVWTREIADLSDAIRLQPDYARNYRYRAVARSKNGDTDGALADFAEAIRVENNDHDNSSNYLDRADFWRERGDLERAIADANKAIELNPGPYTYERRARLWEAKGDFDKAAADWTQAIQLKSKAADGYRDRALFWLRRGEPDRAIEDTTEAIRLQPGDSLPYDDRADAWLKKGEVDRAIADYSEALRLSPHMGYTYSISRGSAYEAKGELERAIADYSQAIKSDGSDSYYLEKALSKRAAAYAKKGESKLAAQDLHQAAQIALDRGLRFLYRADYSYALARLETAYDFVPTAQSALLRYLARQHRGQDGSAELATAAAQLQEKSWPYPAIEFFLGQRSADQMLSAVANPVERCEARFYAAEEHVLRGNRNDAVVALKKAVEICPKKARTASDGAWLELMRLTP